MNTRGPAPVASGLKTPAVTSLKLLPMILFIMCWIFITGISQAQATTTISASISLDPVPLGVGTSITVHVGCGACGVAQILLDGTPVWGATLPSSGETVYFVPASALPTPKSYQVVAKYLGNDSYAPAQTATSFEVRPNANPKPTVTTSFSLNPVPLGLGTTLTTQFSCGACGVGQIFLNGTSIWVGTLPTSGVVFSVPASMLSTAGTYQILAKYFGNGSYAPTQTTTSFQVILKPPPTITASVSLDPVPLGVGTSITVHVGCGACGVAQILLDGTPVWGATLPSSGETVYFVPASALPTPKSYQVVAKYLGNDSYAPAQTATSFEVRPNANPKPTVTTSFSLNPVPLGLGTTLTTQFSCGACGVGQIFLNGTSIWVGTLPTSGVVFSVPASMLSTAGTYQILAKYFGNGSYAPTEVANTFIVLDRTPVITWATPVAITCGAPLSATQLNATANVPGTVTYNHIVGEVLPCGTSTLTASFTPTDPTFYAASATVSILVAGSTAPSNGALIYSYSIIKTDGSSGYDPIGNIAAYDDSVNQRWSASYDALNRLTAASQTVLPTAPSNTVIGASWGNAMQQYFCWQYDSFGNRKAQASSGSPFTDSNSCTNPGTSAFRAIRFSFGHGDNRIDGVTQETTNGTQLHITDDAPSTSGEPKSYDDAGNLLDDGIFQYYYDTENRLCAVRKIVAGPTIAYLYDVAGRRVGKGTVSTVTGSDPCDFSTNAFMLTNEYMPGPNGEQLTEFDGQGNWQHTNVFASGQLIATYDTQGTHYQLNDWLGNRRMQTNATGLPEFTYSSAPFGDQLSDTNGSTEQHFTGKERDGESGLDNFGARYYASAMGRFSSPDPMGNSSADFSNPQSWNMYSYVLNNPLKYTDPTGMYCDYSDHNDPDSGNDSSQFDYHSNSGECTQNHGQWVKDAFTHGGFDDYDRPQGAVSANVTTSTSPQPTTDEAAKDLINSSVPGFLSNVTDLLKGILPQNIKNYELQPGRILFNTTRCGPGGSGPTDGTMNGPCAVHDACYGAVSGGGISASDNRPGGRTMSGAQVAEEKECNQALYDAARSHPDIPGSKAVQWWLVNGSQDIPQVGYILHPGAEAVPW